MRIESSTGSTLNRSALELDLATSALSQQISRLDRLLCDFSTTKRLQF